MSSTNDQFGCIDFTNNEISDLPPLPLLKKLRTMIFINNKISSIHPEFMHSLPNLESLVLTGNKVNDISFSFDFQIFEINGVD